MLQGPRLGCLQVLAVPAAAAVLLRHVVRNLLARKCSL